jgi:hypothetical protein
MSLAGAWRWLTGPDWTFRPASAAIRTIAVVGTIATGVLVDQPTKGVLAAIGALTVGFGASLELGGSRVLLSLATSIGIMAAAVVGSLAAQTTATAVIVAAAFGALCGLAASRGAAPAWTTLQFGIVAMISTSFPAPLESAVKHALFVLAGGLAQTFVLAAARFVRHDPPAPAPADAFAVRYVIHLAVGLSAAIAIERLLALPNGYWVPMTTLLVLRPTQAQTMTRGVTRTLGTLAGCAIASLVALLHPPGPILFALLASSAFCAYAFQRASYGLFAFFVTSYVVFLLTITGLPERTVAVARMNATAVGAAIALAVQGTGELIERARRAVA